MRTHTHSLTHTHTQFWFEFRLKWFTPLVTNPLYTFMSIKNTRPLLHPLQRDSEMPTQITAPLCDNSFFFPPFFWSPKSFSSVFNWLFPCPTSPESLLTHTLFSPKTMLCGNWLCTTCCYATYYLSHLSRIGTNTSFSSASNASLPVQATLACSRFIVTSWLVDMCPRVALGSLVSWPALNSCHAKRKAHRW